MSVQPSPPPAPPVGAIALVLLACFPYAIMLAALLGMPGGDPGSYGGESNIAVAFSQLYALGSGVLLWIVLGILLLLGWINGEMPRWAAIGAGVLYPLSGIAAFVAAGLAYSHPGGWVVVVPALLPPVIALYAMWAHLPALHAVLRPDITSAAALAAITVVSVATVPLSLVDELQFPARLARLQAQGDTVIAQRESDWAKLSRENEARFQGLTPDSTLWDYLNPQGIPDGRGEQAVEGARQVKSRQTDAVMLLAEGKMNWLNELWRLDLEATPSLCEAFGAALRKAAASEVEPSWNVGEKLERQLPNMKWLVAGHCDLDDGVTAVEKRVHLITDVMGAQDGGRPRWLQFLAALAELRPKR
jgi:hypothetical protein